MGNKQMDAEEEKRKTQLFANCKQLNLTGRKT